MALIYESKRMTLICQSTQGIQLVDSIHVTNLPASGWQDGMVGKAESIHAGHSALAETDC